MTDSSTTSSPVGQSGVASETNNNDGVFDPLFKVMDTTVSAMGPYQEQGAAMLIYFVARICVAIAKTARRNRLTAILVVVPSIIAIETALWVIAAGQLSGFIIINVTLLLEALICYYEHICNLLDTFHGKIFGQQGSSTTPSTAQEGANAQMTEPRGNQATV